MTGLLETVVNHRRSLPKLKNVPVSLPKSVSERGARLQGGQSFQPRAPLVLKLDT